MELECEQLGEAASREPSATDPVRQAESGRRGASRPRKQVSDQEHIAYSVQPFGVACDAQPLRTVCVAQPADDACVAQP